MTLALLFLLAFAYGAIGVLAVRRIMRAFESADPVVALVFLFIWPALLAIEVLLWCGRQIVRGLPPDPSNPFERRPPAVRPPAPPPPPAKRGA